MIVCGLTNTEFRNLRVNEQIELPEEEIEVREPYTFTGRKNLKLYTDGSVIGGNMGSACIFLEEGEEPHKIRCRPLQTNASSDKAELFAILRGLEKCSSTIRLAIYTDSQNALKYIKMLRAEISERNIVKIAEYPIVEKIVFEMERFEVKPEIHWVKGHEGDLNNHAAHCLAQSACLDFGIAPKDVTAFKTGKNLKRDFHLHHQLKEDNPGSIYRTDNYPRTFFKEQIALSYRKTNIDRLNRKWGEDCPDLNDDDERDNAAQKAAIEFDLAPDYD